MRRTLIASAFAVGVCLCACACASGAAAVSGPGVTPLPASPVAVQPAPGAAILDSRVVGLPLVASADGITAVAAANDVPDAADALPLYDSWGWVVESRRSFGRVAQAGSGSVEVTVLLTLRVSGAESAFGFLAEQAAVPPLIAAACPASVVGTDQCALGSGGGRVLVVGRVGTEVFEVSATGADAPHLASFQAARLR